MIISDFDYVKPECSTELFAALSKPGSVLLAGGTDLLVQMREGKRSPAHVIDLKGIPELKGIYQEGDQIFIGAAETIQSVVEHPLTQAYGALVAGAGFIGCYEIRCRATIGGNIANASPSADTLPGLLLYDAEVVLLSEQGPTVLKLEDFLLSPGKVALEAGHVLAGVLLPVVHKESKSYFFRASRVKGMDLSGLSVAVYGVCSNGALPTNIRIALGAVWPTVARAHQAERLLNSAPYSDELLDTALKALKEDINPRKESLRATPEYKRAMVEHYLRRAVQAMREGGSHEE